MVVMLDTGGVQTYLPNSDLQAVGYQPYGTGVGGGIVPGATETVEYYRIPAGALQVLDNGRYVAIADQPMVISGVPGNVIGLGPDVLKDGATLNVTGSAWSLQPPCS